MHFFTPNHVQLLNACYPPSSALLSSGRDIAPNSQELSRLTYYASNHPGKFNKLGNELEKRLKAECKKAQAGNLRTRASLLVSLSIFRSLAVECRRDLSLISPFLISAVNATLAALPSDLEVVARAATVFAAWTTYTDGHLIGADSQLTKDYLAILKRFAALSSSKLADQETRNRTRLIGLAALIGALNSEALFNDSVQFKSQVAIIMKPILINFLEASLSTLDNLSVSVKEAPTSPYLPELRGQPTIERRAASIHVHTDGDKGPSNEEVYSASLRALYCSLQHANGSQLGYVIRSSVENLDELQGWNHADHCCWFARMTAEWAQYQYRYAVPTCLMERLLESQDGLTLSSHIALATMLKTLFNSSIPLINLSTSNIISNLITLLLRRSAADPHDSLQALLVECIASLGTHIYYSDQIMDLAGELINRLLLVEAYGIDHEKLISHDGRTQAIRCLITSLRGLIQIANETGSARDSRRMHSASSTTNPPIISPDGIASTEGQVSERPPKRARVSPDTWQDTLSLLCDKDYAVRADYADALTFYILNEIPRYGGSDDVKRSPISLQRVSMHSTDLGLKFLHAVHAHAFILATSTELQSRSSSISYKAKSTGGEEHVMSLSDAFPDSGTSESPESRPSSGIGRRSINTFQIPRSRKFSIVLRLVERLPSRISMSASATLSDYACLLEVLTAVHEGLPVHGLLTGVPMLLTLDEATRVQEVASETLAHRIETIRSLIAKVWLTIGKVWECQRLIDIANSALSTLPNRSELPAVTCSDVVGFKPPREPMPFPSTNGESIPDIWVGVNTEHALFAVVSSPNVQTATGMDDQSLLLRLSEKWTAELALKHSAERTTTFESVRGDVISPLLKISPALMQIENISLQSLARSARGVGVTDLREALEGRSSLSNPALAKPSSISTLDHTSSIIGDVRLTKTRSRTRPKKRAIPSGSGEVRDVLNRLGIGKQNGSLLKASFPAIQKPENR